MENPVRNYSGSGFQGSQLAKKVHKERPLQNPPPFFGQFWSLRGAKRRGNLVAYQCVMRLLRFARNDNTGVMQSSQRVFAAE